MKKRLAISLVGLFAFVMAVKIYIDRMPDHGIRSRWKKLLLQTIVPGDVPTISVESSIAKKNAVLFLDTRAKEEYDVSHIKGARFGGYKEFSLDDLNDVPKEQPIITYCSIGKRSGEIGKKLRDAGFTNVQNLYGGLFEWVNQGYPVVDAKGRTTKKVHAYNKLWGTWLNRGQKVY